MTIFMFFVCIIGVMLFLIARRKYKPIIDQKNAEIASLEREFDRFQKGERTERK